MATNYPSAFRALPFSLFFFYEFANTILFYEFQVFNHAHPEMGLVTIVKMRMSVAGEIFTFKAKIDFVVQQ